MLWWTILATYIAHPVVQHIPNPCFLSLMAFCIVNISRTLVYWVEWHPQTWRAILDRHIAHHVVRHIPSEPSFIAFILSSYDVSSNICLVLEAGCAEAQGFLGRAWQQLSTRT